MAGETKPQPQQRLMDGGTRHSRRSMTFFFFFFFFSRPLQRATT